MIAQRHSPSFLSAPQAASTLQPPKAVSEYQLCRTRLTPTHKQDGCPDVLTNSGSFQLSQPQTVPSFDSSCCYMSQCTMSLPFVNQNITANTQTLISSMTFTMQNATGQSSTLLLSIPPQPPLDFPRATSLDQIPTLSHNHTHNTLSKPFSSCV